MQVPSLHEDVILENPEKGNTRDQPRLLYKKIQCGEGMWHQLFHYSESGILPGTGRAAE